MTRARPRRGREEETDKENKKPAGKASPRRALAATSPARTTSATTAAAASSPRAEPALPLRGDILACSEPLLYTKRELVIAASDGAWYEGQIKKVNLSKPETPYQVRAKRMQPSVLVNTCHLSVQI